MHSFYSPLSISSPPCVFKVTEKLLARRKEKNESKDLSHTWKSNKENVLVPDYWAGLFSRPAL